MSNLIEYNTPQLQLIKRTYAKKLNDDEFDMYIEISKRRGLSILEKHIFAQVFNKDDPEKRTVVFVTSIDGARYIAEGTKEYRPDDQDPKFVHAAEGSYTPATNPKGIDSATVRIYKMDSRGNWFAVSGTAKWEEFAKMEYGKLADGWVKMPYHMLAKCAEMQALRKAFPSQFGGLYTQEETDNNSMDLASDAVKKEAFEKKTSHIQDAGKSVGLLLPNEQAIKAIPLGQVYDIVLPLVRDKPLNEIMNFMVQNKESLQVYYKHEPDGAKDIHSLYVRRQEEEIKNPSNEGSNVIAGGQPPLI